MSVALNQRGDAYVYGASGPNAFDCSGLVQYSFGQAGINLPRTSSAQAGATRRIAKDDMQPGDLMFFAGSGGVYHAAIFLRWENGHALMVHSPGSGRSVTVARPVDRRLVRRHRALTRAATSHPVRPLRGAPSPRGWGARHTWRRTTSTTHRSESPVLPRLPRA